MGKAKRKRSTNSSPTSPDSVYHYKSVNVKKAKRKRSTYVTPTISDSVDLFCQHCSTDDLHMEASHYCERCKAYMCDSCFEYHQDYQSYQYHRPLYSKPYMPKDKMIPRTLDTPTQRCPKHLDKILEYFCDIHKDLCCTVCLYMDHIACKKKSYVPYISSQTTKTREYKNLLIKLDWLIDMATRQQMHIKKDQQDNESYHTKAMSDIKMGLESEDEILDQQVKDLLQKVADLHQSNAKSIDTAAQKCQTVLSEVRQMRLDFDDQEKGRKNNQLFVGMKLAHIRLHTIEDEISEVMEHKISRFVFNKDEEAHETTSTPSADHPAPQTANMQQTTDHPAPQIANMQQCAPSVDHPASQIANMQQSTPSTDHPSPQIANMQQTTDHPAPQIANMQQTTDHPAPQIANMQQTTDHPAPQIANMQQTTDHPAPQIANMQQSAPSVDHPASQIANMQQSTPSTDHPAPQIANMQQSANHPAPQIANMQQSTPSADHPAPHIANMQQSTPSADHPAPQIANMQQSTPSADHPASQIENMQQSTPSVDHSAPQIANKQQSTACLLSVRQDGENLKARYLREVCVKIRSDEYDCHITGIELLPGDRMVVIDYENSNVKLVDINRNKITSMLSLCGPRGKGTGRPSAVTRTTSNPNQVAVSLSENMKIEIITVSDVLSRNRTIKVPGDYFDSLCFDGHYFYLLYSRSHSIKKLDMSGRLVSTVYTDSNSDPLINYPEHIALSRDKDILYVTDEWNNTPGHTVKCITLTGQVVAVYSHAMLAGLSGVAVGGDGCVYVCGKDSHSVNQLTASGRHIAVLQDRQPELAEWQRAKTWNEDDCYGWLHDKDPNMIFRPDAIAVNAENDTMAISHQRFSQLRNLVCLYKLEKSC